MSSSIFAAVEMAPRDPILGLNESFNADARTTKVNLGVGVYFDDNGKIPLLAAVKAVGGGNIPSGDISARELETQYNIKYFPIDDKSLYACYYKHFIKHLDNGEKRKLGVMEYGVVRNNWYRVTIADIAGLGSGIINIEPTRPVEEDDILLTDYYVSPWQFRPDDTVLSQPRKK